LTPPSNAPVDETGVAVAIVSGAFVAVGKHTVCFGGFAEALFDVFFTGRVTIRMPLERGLAVGGLNLFGSGRARDGQELRNNRVCSRSPCFMC
jgi:hypothetical protein